jgi:hypothetical protein
MEANDYRAGSRRQLHLPVFTGNRDRYKQLPVPRAQGDREETGIEGTTHQMLGHTCSTYMAQITTVKDVHSSSKTLTGALHQVRTGERPRSLRVTQPRPMSRHTEKQYGFDSESN